jgi:hypothetical protein
MRSGSQKALLLKVFADGSILTDDEAAERAGLLAKIGCCWWHRCSDLRKEGHIKQVTLKVSRLTGEWRMGCMITDHGLNTYKEIKQ